MTEAAPQSEPIIERKRRPWLLPVILGGVLVVVGGAIAFGVVSYKNEHAHVRAQSFGKAAYCLIGGDLGPNERASIRYREIERAIAIDHTELVAWPGSCQKPLEDLVFMLRKYGDLKEGEQDTAYWANALSKKNPADRLDYTRTLDAFFDAAKKDQLGYEQPGDASPALARLDAWSIDNLQKTGVLSETAVLTRLSTDTVPGATLRLAVPERSGATVCTSKDGALKCHPPAIKGAPPDWNLIFLYGTADDDGAAVIADGRRAFMEDGTELVVSGQSFRGMWMRKDGVGYEVLKEGDNKKDDVRLHRHHPPGPAAEAVVKLEHRWHLEALRDWIVWHDEEGNLYGKHVELDGPKPGVGPLVTIGKGLAPNADLRACVQKDGMTVVESTAGQTQIWTQRGGAWSGPQSIASSEPRMFCDDRGVAFLSDEIVFDCPAGSGCTSRKRNEDKHRQEIHSDTHGEDAVVLDGPTATVAFLRRAKDNDVLSVSVYAGEKKLWETAFDPYVKDGRLVKDPQLSDARLFGRRDSALLVIKAGSLRALRVDKSGVKDLPVESTN